MIKIYITILLLLFLPTSFAKNQLNKGDERLNANTKIPSFYMYQFIGTGGAEIISQSALNLKDKRVLILSTVRIKEKVIRVVNSVYYVAQKHTIYRCKEFLRTDYTELKAGTCWRIDS